MNKQPDISGHPEWGNEDYCTEADGPHVPNENYLIKADGVSWVIDTICKNCGRSGSTSIDPASFGW